MAGTGTPGGNGVGAHGLGAHRSDAHGLGGHADAAELAAAMLLQRRAAQEGSDAAARIRAAADLLEEGAARMTLEGQEGWLGPARASFDLRGALLARDVGLHVDDLRRLATTIMAASR